MGHFVDLMAIRRSKALGAAVASFVSAIVLGASPSSALTIVPTFDSSLLSDANSASMLTDLAVVIQTYQQLFTDPITINIDFQTKAGPVCSAVTCGNFLGASLATRYSGVNNYTQFKNALIADAKTPNDTAATANLPGSNSAPVEFASANGRAIGLNTPGALKANGTGGGGFDGIVILNTNQPFGYTRTNNGTTVSGYDFIRVAEHEIDEVLGLGSALNGCGAAVGCIMPEDLFRYLSPGNLSFTTSGSASSYFSINGGFTNLANFNQNGGGDYGDWLQGTGDVQDAFSFANQVANIGANSPEGIALDAIGYDLAVPEPASAAIVGAGLVGLTTVRRSQRRRAAR